MVSVSAITALWSASRGIYGVSTGLNFIYGAAEDRGYFYTRSVSVGYTFAFLLVLFLTLICNVFGNTILQMIPVESTPILRIINLRLILLLLVQTALFTAMYMVLPNRKNRFSDSLPGAVLAAVGWQLFSHVFSLYVENMVSRYTNIYGSVYTVAIGLLWVYWCMCILLFGGLVNRLLQWNSPP